MSEPLDQIFLFTAPFFQCSKCRGVIHLPYGELPRTTLDRLFGIEVEDQISWPPDEWRATFGCSKCGLVNNCAADDVLASSGRYGDARGYHDAATLFAATFPCGKLHCKAPAIMYANIESGGAVKYLRLLRSGFFQGKLPCGHDIAAVPEKYYKIERVTERLW